MFDGMLEPILYLKIVEFCLWLALERCKRARLSSLNFCAERKLKRIWTSLGVGRKIQKTVNKRASKPTWLSDQTTNMIKEKGASMKCYLR